MNEPKIGGFDSVLDFAFYAEAHYIPLLERVGKSESLSDKDRRLLGFLRDDLNSFVENVEEGNNE